MTVHTYFKELQYCMYVYVSSIHRHSRPSRFVYICILRVLQYMCPWESCHCSCVDSSVLTFFRIEQNNQVIHPPRLTLTNRTWKWWFGRCFSFSRGPVFSTFQPFILPGDTWFIEQCRNSNEYLLLGRTMCWNFLLAGCDVATSGLTWGHEIEVVYVNAGLQKRIVEFGRKNVMAAFLLPSLLLENVREPHRGMTSQAVCWSPPSQLVPCRRPKRRLAAKRIGQITELSELSKLCEIARVGVYIHI